MKSKIPQQYLYLAIVSIILLVFVLLFSFLVLIPQGKEYRLARINYKQEFNELKKYKNFYDDTFSTLKTLQSENRHTIESLDRPFDPKRFETQSKPYFTTLQITQINRGKNLDGFVTYEVNTTSKINSPLNFYNFLEALNKGDWITEANFPITFQRDGEGIKSSFTMKVYSNNKETNTSASESEAK